MPPRVTSSNLERAAACPYSAASPGIDTTGKWAARGTSVNAFADAAYLFDRDTALRDVAPDAPHRRMCERLKLEDLPWWHGKLPQSATVRLQPSAALLCETRVMRALPNRDAYEALDTWDHAGTSDVVVDLPNEDRVDVYDLKTGSPTQVTLPAENDQLHSYALLFARLLGRSTARVHITNVYEDGGVFTPRGHDLDALDLRAFEARVVRTIERAREASTATDPRPYLKRGPQCKYCPRFTECPAQLAVFRALIMGVTQQQPTAISVRDVKDARAFFKDAKHWMEELDETIKGYARVEPVPTDKPGVVYREVAGTKREIVAPRVALRVLTERYGEDVAEAAVTVSTSVGAIEDAVEAHAKAKGAKAAPMKRDAFAALIDAGAIVETETHTVREARVDAA